MKRKVITQLKPIVALLSLGFSCTQAYAIPIAPGKIYHPIHYLPNTPHLLPSGLSPAQIRQAYGINNLRAGGRGQTIAIIDAYDHPRIESDLAVFNQQFGLATCTTANGCFQKVFSGQTPQPDAGWSGEIALDVEWAHAIAPKAKIMLVETPTPDTQDLFNGIQVAIQRGATIVSMSWGSPEYPYQVEFEKTFSSNPNITFVTSSGDSGTGANFPASSPYVLAVGGTTLNIDSQGNYLGESAWAGSSGGVSTVDQWPAYQSNLPIPLSNGMRGVPDVAWNADPQSGFSVFNSIPNPEEGEPAGWQVVGGTSAGAPQWAGLIAIANAATGRNIGSNINALLYNYASPSSGLYSHIYHDVSSGTNGQCGFICTAQIGYDYVTGLGSVAADNMVHQMRQTPPVS